MSLRLFLRRTALLLLLAGAATSHAQKSAKATANLVQPTYNPVTDSLGFNWDIQQGGYISNGSNCFSGGFNLMINGNGFSPRQAQMTPDGTEYFLTGPMNNIEVTRRVRVDVKNATCRFLETLRNTGPAQATVNLQIQTQFNNRMQSTLSDTGTPLTTQLGAKDSAIIAVGPANQNPPPPSVLWVVASSGGKVRPTMQNNQNARLIVTYPVTLAPGASISFVHVAAQRQLAGTDAKALAKMLAPLKSSRVLADLTPKERKALANFRADGLAAGEMVLSSLLEKLDIERGATDVLAIGKDTRLKGTATCAALAVETRRGLVKVPFEQVAAVVGAGGPGRVILRDGQALNGRLTAEGLKFTLTTGTTMELNVAALDRLVLRAGPAVVPTEGGAWAVVETADGDRLVVKADPSFRLRFQTAWGVREITADELAGCGPVEDTPFGLFIMLQDGSRFIGLLAGAEVSFETVLLGRQSLPANAIVRIAVLRAKGSDDEAERSPGGARVTLLGGQVLGGQIDLAELHFQSPSGVIPVPPNLVRTLRATDDRSSGEPPLFTAELWGGGTVAGALRETVLPVRAGGRVLQVPVDELVEAVVPSPVTPEGLREKIAVFIRDLGHADWAKRETASRELGELGVMARAPLDEVRQQTTDAEVRHRAEALLEAIKE